jgi:hypothetical protein
MPNRIGELPSRRRASSPGRNYTTTFVTEATLVSLIKELRRALDGDGILVGAMLLVYRASPTGMTTETQGF